MDEDGNTEKTPSELSLNMLVDELLISSVCCDNKRTVGYVIMHLSKEKRELCRLLKPHHFNHRVNV